VYDTLYFANSIIERVRSRARLKTFSDTEASCKSFYRSTYMSLNIREDDLRMTGEKIGFERGRRDGVAAGSYQKARETAKLMQRESCSVDFIQRMTGLSKAEIENL